MKTLSPPPPELLSGAALFLDFDGTLVELAETPDTIHVPGALPELLRRLAVRLDGRIAVVSGRSIADLDRHLDCSAMAVAGSHGLELRLADGSQLPLSAPGGLEAARQDVEALAAADERLLVETKPVGLALHFRQAPEQEEQAVAAMGRLAQRHGLALQQGKMVVELRPAGADKGDSVQALMARPPFSGARPVFVGDDLTDEHGFRAAALLGGAGVLVGEPRETSAAYRLKGVAAVAEWLALAA